MWYLDTRQSFMFYPTASWVCSILSQKELRTAEECFQRKKDCPSHYYLHYCFWPLSPFLSVSVSVVLYLARLFHPSPSTPLCHPPRSSSARRIAIKSEMFLLLMHTNAQRLTGADSMKRGAAEINTYVMREKEPPNGSPICVCQRLSEGRIDI